MLIFACILRIILLGLWKKSHWDQRSTNEIDNSQGSIGEDNKKMSYFIM